MAIAITPTTETYDPRFNQLVPRDAALIKIASGGAHTEGPVYVPADDSLVWSDVIGNQAMKWRSGEISVVRSPSCYQNGNALDLEGRLVSCSHGDRAIIRQDRDGEWRILVDRYEGKRLNSPNDITVKSDGTIWFTDPPFGLTQASEGCGGEQEQEGSYVFRFDPSTDEINAVVKTMERPNGLAFSPDESILYVSDTSAFENPEMYHDIRAYRVIDNRQLGEGEIFAVVSPGQPDGLCVDWQGNLFSSSQDSVQVYAPDGTFLGKIFTPEVCANLTFGGKDGNRLFITAGASVYAIDLNTKGIAR